MFAACACVSRRKQPRRFAHACAGPAPLDLCSHQHAQAAPVIAPRHRNASAPPMRSHRPVQPAFPCQRSHRHAAAETVGSFRQQRQPAHVHAAAGERLIQSTIRAGVGCQQHIMVGRSPQGGSAPCPLPASLACGMPQPGLLWLAGWWHRYRWLQMGLGRCQAPRTGAEWQA